MSEREKFCEKVEKLRLDESTGRQLEPEDVKFIETHFERCSSCALEEEVVSKMAFDGTAGPAPELDDLSCRRWVDTVLERASRMPAANDHGSGVRRWAVVAVAASALLAVGLGAFFLFGSPKEDRAGGSTVAMGQSNSRLMMSYGEVERNGEILALDSSIRRGDRLVVGDGGAVVSLSEGIDAYMEEDTTATVRKVSARELELVLERGMLIAKVDPGHKGPRFVVATEKGKVFVTGTVFSVEASEEHQVAVYRGSIRLEDELDGGRNVRMGEAAVFGRDGIVPQRAGMESRVNEVLAVMELLTPGDGASMDIESVPSGALVRLDGAVLGRTPVMACVREGHRRLELSLDEYDTVRELVELGEGDKLHRVFELGITKDSDSGEATVAASADRQATPEAPVAKPLSPAELLEKAQRYLIERDWRAAVRTYRELCRVHPSSSEARTALVSKGNIQLEKLGSPTAALKSFNKYLSRSSSGALAQEASFGRARALRALGNTELERDALEDFIRDFPTAIQIPRVKARLDQLQ